MHGYILAFFIISWHTIHFKSCKKIILQPHKYSCVSHACANWYNSVLCLLGGELHASRQWEEPRGAGEGAELWHNQPGEGEDLGRHLQECSLFAPTKSFWHGPGYDKHYAIFRCRYPLKLLRLHLPWSGDLVCESMTFAVLEWWVKWRWLVVVTSILAFDSHSSSHPVICNLTDRVLGNNCDRSFRNKVHKFPFTWQFTWI